MCAPAVFALGSLAVGLASQATSFIGQTQAANNQANYQSQLASLESRRQQQEQEQLLLKNQQEQQSLFTQQAQQNEQAARELNKVAMEARAASSRATVAAGEAGVSGLSVDALLGDITRQELGYFEASTRQGQMRDQYYAETTKNMQKALEMNLDYSRMGSQMNLAQINRPIAKPSWAAFGINLGTQTLGAADAYQRMKYYQNLPGQGSSVDLSSLS
jgi:hypothetical protein